MPAAEGLTPRFHKPLESSQITFDAGGHRSHQGGHALGLVLEEWRAEVTEQVPDQRVAWRNRAGVHPTGVVTFHRLTPGRTRVILRIDAPP